MSECVSDCVCVVFSRVGSRCTYAFVVASSATFSIRNLVRVADVWMDDYAKVYKG